MCCYVKINVLKKCHRKEVLKSSVDMFSLSKNLIILLKIKIKQIKFKYILKWFTINQTDTVVIDNQNVLSKTCFYQTKKVLKVVWFMVITLIWVNL